MGRWGRSEIFATRVRPASTFGHSGVIDNLYSGLCRILPFPTASTDNRRSATANCRHSEKRLLKLHRYRFPLGRLRDIEELLLLDVEHSRDDISWEGLNLGVQVAHHGVCLLYTSPSP